jgi:C1A family cysteine protease
VSVEFLKGCIPSPADVRDYKVKAAASAVLPESFIISPMPRVKNQGSVAACVAHALSTIMEYHDSKCGEAHILSTNFIYGIQKKYCGHDGKGMYLRQACKIGTDLGTPQKSYCPGNTEVPNVHALAEGAYENKEAMQNANYFKLASYARCKSEKDIKTALMNYGPVLCSINWRDTFKINSEGILTGEDIGDDGYHALVIYGWNETGWLIQNSWGHSWGKQGRFTCPYSYKISEAWSIIDGEQDIDKHNDDLHIIKPIRGNIIDIVYKVLNALCKFFSKYK